MRFIDLLAALMAAAAMADAGTQPPPTPAPGVAGEAATTASATSPDACTVLAGTPVELEVAEPIASSRHKRGDKFGLRLYSPLMHDGVTCLPAGVQGLGEVVHAMPARGGGKPGELLLAGRYLEFSGTRVPLRGMKANATGDSNYGAAMGASFAMGPFAMFIRGREIEIPAGARVTARLAEDFVWPADAGSTPVVVDPPVTTVPNQE